MKTKECPSCAMNIPDNTKVCPICSYEFASHSGWVKWTAIILLILIVLYYLMR